MKDPKEKRKESGLTWVEFLICTAIILVFMVIFMPHLLERDMMKRAQMTQALSDMKQLHLATQQMALDRTTTGEKTIGWPGDTGGSFTNWAGPLVAGGYLTARDLSRLLSVAGQSSPPDAWAGANTNGILVYAVGSNSPASAVFLSTANFTNTPGGGVAPGASAIPFGDGGFVVFRKGGDGTILKAKQAGKTNVMGTFAPLCK